MIEEIKGKLWMAESRYLVARGWEVYCGSGNDPSIYFHRILYSSTDLSEKFKTFTHEEALKIQKEIDFK